MRPKVRLSPCAGGTCLKRVTCMCFRAVELEGEVLEPHTWKGPGIDCPRYVVITSGVKLHRWEEQRLLPRR